METPYSYETVVKIYQNTVYHIPGDNNVNRKSLLTCVYVSFPALYGGLCVALM
jgi:hypothetical protein